MTTGTHVLQSINQLYDDRIGALDGDVGHVEDLYFDDRSWAVRYLVTDTGSWLAGRKVLISPHAFGGLDRVDSPVARERWLADVTGYDRPSTEVAKRVLRVVSPGSRKRRSSRWRPRNSPRSGMWAAMWSPSSAISRTSR